MYILVLIYAIFTKSLFTFHFQGWTSRVWRHVRSSECNIRTVFDLVWSLLFSTSSRSRLDKSSSAFSLPLRHGDLVQCFFKACVPRFAVRQLFHVHLAGQLFRVLGHHDVRYNAVRPLVIWIKCKYFPWIDSHRFISM